VKRLAAAHLALLVGHLSPTGHAAVIDPNRYSEGEFLTDIGVGAILSGAGERRAVAFGFTFPPAVIGGYHPDGPSYSCCWRTEYGFRIDFLEPTDSATVWITRGGPSGTWTGSGFLEVFDRDGDLLEVVTSPTLYPTFGQAAYPLSVVHPSRDIAAIMLGDLVEVGWRGVQIARIEFATPEPAAGLLLILAAGGVVGLRAASRRAKRVNI
jgi:hypothetical protein